MTRERIKIVILLLLSYSTVATSQEIQFTDLENLPEARSALTSANNGEAIFVVNGFGGNEQYTEEVFRYDVSLDSWSVLTASTIPKRFASAAIIGDFLYVFNGLTENGVPNSAVEKIDVNTGSIQYLADNPQPCEAAGVTTWENKIYSFGGRLGVNEYSNKLYEFDPQDDTWTLVAEIPFAGETKGEIVDGKLYVIGGFNGTVSNRIDVYNLTSGVWESNFAMPVGISAHSTALMGRKIYLVGDFINLSSIAYFDTVDNSFQSLSNNLNQRRHCAAEEVGGSLFAIGGNTTSTIQSAIASVQKADITTSIREISYLESIEIHPNPTNRILTLNREFERLYIYDAQGKEIQNFKNVADLDLRELKEGIYFLRAYIGRKLYQAKFVKI